MTYVVTENCINCKYTDCVAVCPVDCFHEGPNFLIIHPDECIDCDACVPVCPAKAIYRDVDLPQNLQHFLGLNEELSRAWPSITAQREPASDAASWDGVPDKLAYLER